MWQPNPLDDAPKYIEKLQKTYLIVSHLPVFKNIETLETYTLKLNKSIYKSQIRNFTVTWRSRVCKVTKNDILHRTFIFFVFTVRHGNSNLQKSVSVIFCQEKNASICVLPFLSNYYRYLWIGFFSLNQPWRLCNKFIY